jgi:hypothetical protein
MLHKRTRKTNPLERCCGRKEGESETLMHPIEFSSNYITPHVISRRSEMVANTVYAYFLGAKK